NFGVIDIRLYGNSSLGTSPSCTAGGDNARLINNAAVGADHEVVPFAGVTVLDDCVQSKPNTIDVTTGDKSSAFDTGMLSGGPAGHGPDRPVQPGLHPAVVRQVQLVELRDRLRSGRGRRAPEPAREGRGHHRVRDPRADAARELGHQPLPARTEPVHRARALARARPQWDQSPSALSRRRLSAPLMIAFAGEVSIVVII